MPPWYRTTLVTVVTLVTVFPVGLGLMWTRSPGWGRVRDWTVTAAVPALSGASKPSAPALATCGQAGLLQAPPGTPAPPL